MGLETATFVSGLNTANPLGSDVKSQGDDHLRLIKSVLQSTFPNASKAFRFPNSLASQTSTYNCSASTCDNLVIPCDASGGAFTVNLPATPGLDGMTVVVVKMDASANAVTVDGNTQTINGTTSVTLTARWQFGIFRWLSTAGVWVADFSLDVSSYVTLTGAQNLTNKTITSPTLITPMLGTPASGNLANCTGLPIAGGGTGAASAVDAFANLKQAATTSASGVVELAVKAEMEAAADAGRVAALNMLIHHPGIAKAHAKITWSGSTASLTSGVNVASVTDGANGLVTINFTTAFANTDYVVSLTTEPSSSQARTPMVEIGGQSTGSLVVRIRDDESTSLDPAVLHFVAFGTLAS